MIKIKHKKLHLGATLLSGFVCALHLATPGSSSKHTINAFINFYLNCVMWKRRK